MPLPVADTEDESQLESTVLQAVQHQLPIPTPVLHEVGEADGWAYVLMGKLDGDVLYTVWPKLSDSERLDIASQLGEALAALHQLEPPDIEPDWDTFIKAQRENCVERHRKTGLGEHWLAQIPAFIGEETTTRKALLHTEISREHLLVKDGRLTGLFDFEPAMAGAPEYEFAGLGFFVSQGDATIPRRALESLGV
ncbi:aminoglycoside 3'-phosphotransferase/choline kinase family protein [Actinocrispum sp. NPDC049592]|uniref:aminoglycoside phosphotransferase family protein n=1 Tax=Actinocrispum sp. NPDC049592 TaxID=3154835 RepID=UPI0034443125